jgi:hypothetical protein
VSSSRLWSVTTITGEGVPSRALLGWAVKATAEWVCENADAVRVMVESDRDAALDLIKGARFRRSGPAAIRGTALHKAAEALAYGETPEIEPFHQPWLDVYRQFVADYRPVWELAEAPVYNLTYHYAGTLDGIATIGGRRLLVDFKTHEKTVDQPQPPYPETALQLCAYRHAELIGLGAPRQVNWQGRRYYLYDDETPTTPMLPVDGAICVAVAPTYYTVTPIRTDDDVWQFFLYAREMARWILDVSGTVLGPQMRPPSFDEIPDEVAVSATEGATDGN